MPSTTCYPKSLEKKIFLVTLYIEFNPFAAELF
jgi:hypothetical protein